MGLKMHQFMSQTTSLLKKVPREELKESVWNQRSLLAHDILENKRKLMQLMQQWSEWQARRQHHVKGIDDKVITVVFLKGGTEFTAIVIDVGTANNSDLVLLPTKGNQSQKGAIIQRFCKVWPSYFLVGY
ncbi:uncharacterized protein [Miscanthus floridulus]|uniref:uncharacterized protein isoform X2 n=1 Tax=Miscanthus floridulus TaxID=154761 RepID=UPI00345A75C2